MLKCWKKMRRTYRRVVGRRMVGARRGPQASVSDSIVAQGGQSCEPRDFLSPNVKIQLRANGASPPYPSAELELQSCLARRRGNLDHYTAREPWGGRSPGYALTLDKHD